MKINHIKKQTIIPRTDNMIVVNIYIKLIMYIEN